jgi:kynurenine formamidase
MNRKKYVKLSYDLSLSTPLPPDIPKVEIDKYHSISTDGSNIYKISLTSHSGTHVDSPLHMMPGGIAITNFNIDEFIYNKPCCIKIPLKDCELIQMQHLEYYKDIIALSDLLLIKTGFGKYRKSDPTRYSYRNPGFSEKAAIYIRDCFQNIRAIGLDSISLAAIKNLDEGLKAHKILLGGEGKKFLIYEDLDLKYDLLKLKQVIALPWFIEGIDSAPCTILGVIEE